MKRSKKLWILLAVLAVVCAAAFAATRHQERVEQIKNSDEIILELPVESVQALSWTDQDTSLAFHREDGWIYDGDAAFPVDDEKVDALLERFAAFGVSFVIENVEDYGQYGLDEPVCTIDLTAAEKSYTITLGNFSNMDEERYVSIGDGNVYLVQSDPMDDFDAVLSDLIDNDETPSFDRVDEIRFEGEESYAVDYEEDSAATYCPDDVYFTERSGRRVPLDTSRVENYLSALSSLNLTDYATYSATEEELEKYAMAEPELTVAVDYAAGEDGETAETFVLHVSRDQEVLADAEEGEAVAGYARVDQSPIVYRISAAECGALLGAAYDDLRHREVLTADFADVTGLDITLEGESYALTAEGNGDERTWYYGEEELEITALQSALEALEADSFTDEQPNQKEEIGLTVHLDNANYPEVALSLYRYDGTYCLAAVDGEPVSLVERAAVVDLIEAVNAIVLN